MRPPNREGWSKIWGAILRAPDATPEQLAEQTGYHVMSVRFVIKTMRALGWSWRPKPERARPRLSPDGRGGVQAAPRPAVASPPQRSTTTLVETEHDPVKALARKMGIAGVAKLDDLAPHLKTGGGLGESRDEKAVRMSARGWPVDAIARDLGVTERSVNRMLARARRS